MPAAGMGAPRGQPQSAFMRTHNPAIDPTDTAGATGHFFPTDGRYTLNGPAVGIPEPRGAVLQFAHGGLAVGRSTRVGSR